MQDLNLLTYARGTSAHECGHIVVLFEKGRFVDLTFLPHETATDGIKGVFETDTGTELGEGDCVALAAGMAGELVHLRQYDSGRVLHDRQQVQRLVGRALEDFVQEAEEIIEQNLRFFSLLNVEVRDKISNLLSRSATLRNLCGPTIKLWLPSVHAHFGRQSLEYFC